MVKNQPVMTAQTEICFLKKTKNKQTVKYILNNYLTGIKIPTDTFTVTVTGVCICKNQRLHKQNELTNHFLVSSCSVKDECAAISNYRSER